MSSAAAARRAIARAGGLTSLAGLARAWGVSRGRVSQLATLDDFPAPVALRNGGEVYIAAECDQWRAGRDVEKYTPKTRRGGEG